MRVRRLSSIGLFALVVLTSSLTTLAQYRDSLGQPWSNPVSATMSTMIWTEINKMTMYGPANRRSSGTSRRTTTTTESKPEVVPAYRLYPAVRFKSTGTRLTLQEMVDGFAGTPQEKTEMKKLLSGILDKYDAAAAAKGYPNDLALAIVSYIGLNSQAYNQRSEETILPFEQNIGLRDMFAESAVDNGIFKDLTDRQKQEMYETFVMIGGVTYHFYEEARKKNNVEELKACKLVAEKNLGYIGIKP